MQACLVQASREVGRGLEDRIERNARLNELVGRQIAGQVFEDDEASSIGNSSPADQRCGGNLPIFQKLVACHVSLGGCLNVMNSGITLDMPADGSTVSEMSIKCAVLSIGQLSPGDDARIIEDRLRIETHLAKNRLLIWSDMELV